MNHPIPCPAVEFTFSGSPPVERALRTGQLLALLPICWLLGGCATNWQTASLAVGAVTAVGGQAPTHEVEQIYYLGIYDPEEQLPQQIYRVKVHGQSSLLSNVRFSSGWVPAKLVDTLDVSLNFDQERNRLTLQPSSNHADIAALQSGKKHVLFGPEGHRVAPKDHRLVIVMASSAEKYFDTITDTLDQVSKFQTQTDNSRVVRELMLELSRRSLEREKLEQMQRRFPDDQR